MTSAAEDVSSDAPVVPGERRGPRNAGRESAPRWGVRLRNYLSNHVTLFLAGIVQLERSPWAAWRSCFALGAMLVLPVVFLAVLTHARDLAANLGASGEVAVYLRDGASDEQAEQLIQQLQGMDEVAAVTHITPAQALDELKQVARLDDALRLLDRNPLPHVLMVTPKHDYVTTERVAALRDRVGQLDGVASAEADTDWVDRAQRWLEAGRYLAMALALLLVVAVVPTIGNTVRLLVDRRRSEIEVLQLVGASRAFIRRPYLYLGAWTGVLSSVVAWWLVNLLIWLLAPHVADIGQALGMPVQLHLLGWESLWPIAAISATAGWLAARFAVRRQLRLFSSI